MCVLCTRRNNFWLLCETNCAARGCSIFPATVVVVGGVCLSKVGRTKSCCCLLLLLVYTRENALAKHAHTHTNRLVVRMKALFLNGANCWNLFGCSDKLSGWTLRDRLWKFAMDLRPPEANVFFYDARSSTFQALLSCCSSVMICWMILHHQAVTLRDFIYLLL